MAGKEDLKAISSFIYSKARGSKDIPGDTHAIGSVLMNRATAFGDLGQAIQSMEPDQKNFGDAMTGNLKGKDLSNYKKIIQHSSKLLRGSVDETGGAMHVFSKETSPSAKLMKESGLQKTHATKNFNFYRQSASPAVKTTGRVQKLS